MSACDDFVVEYREEKDFISMPRMVKVKWKRWVRLPGKYYQSDAVNLAKALRQTTEVRAFFVNYDNGEELPINNLDTMDYL